MICKHNFAVITVDYWLFPIWNSEGIKVAFLNFACSLWALRERNWIPKLSKYISIERIRYRLAFAWYGKRNWMPSLWQKIHGSKQIYSTKWPMFVTYGATSALVKPHTATPNDTNRLDEPVFAFVTSNTQFPFNKLILVNGFDWCTSHLTLQFDDILKVILGDWCMIANLCSMLWYFNGNLGNLKESNGYSLCPNHNLKYSIENWRNFKWL